MSEPLTTGQCLCGAVRYSITGAPLRMAHCHCLDCQRASGAGHMSVAFFKAEQVEITGETKAYPVTAESGNINSRYFCPLCGGRVATENSARPGMIGVTVGSMNEKDWFAPHAVVFTRHRESWDQTPLDVPNFEGMPRAAK